VRYGNGDVKSLLRKFVFFCWFCGSFQFVNCEEDFLHIRVLAPRIVFLKVFKMFIECCISAFVQEAFIQVWSGSRNRGN